jgi:glutamate-5-semialdehyde dehydrogenase
MTQTAPSQATSGDEQAAAERPDAVTAVRAIADRARTASRRMARANRSWKDKALLEIANSLLAKRDLILHANRLDVEAGRENGTSAAMLDRLSLSAERIASLADALKNLAGQPDPVGTVMRGQTLPNGLRLRQVHVPMGVVAAIYEARPNVTVDIAGLALKSGNAVVLRGGSAAAQTNVALIGVIRDALDRVGLPADAVQSVDEYGREGANALMQVRGRIDVLIPRAAAT